MAEPLRASLQSALSDLVKWLAAERAPAVLIGGVAASVLGRPRFTQDVDALVILPEAQWERAIQGAAGFGIVPRITDALGFARRSRVLLMRHTDSGIDLDITFGSLPFEQAAVEHGSVHDVSGMPIPLPRVEDLLVMKALAQRPKDLEDVRGLLASHPDTDVNHVRRWVREFAAALGTPQLLDAFERLLAERDLGG